MCHCVLAVEVYCVCVRLALFKRQVLHTFADIDKSPPSIANLCGAANLDVLMYARCFYAQVHDMRMIPIVSTSTHNFVDL